VNLTVRVLWFCWLAASAAAHTVGISMVQGKLSTTALELTTGFAPVDAQRLLPSEGAGAGKFTPADFAAAKKRFEGIGQDLWEATIDGARVVPFEVQVELLPGDNFSFRLVFPVHAAARSLRLRASRLGLLPPDHREFVIISDAGGFTRAKKMLQAADDGLDVPLVASDSMAGDRAVVSEPRRHRRFGRSSSLGSTTSGRVTTTCCSYLPCSWSAEASARLPSSSPVSRSPIPPRWPWRPSMP
jgi:hypothetical protein